MGDTKLTRDLGRRVVRRLGGYCAAAILLLSLPTFSYWVPDNPVHSPNGRSDHREKPGMRLAHRYPRTPGPGVPFGRGLSQSGFVSSNEAGVSDEPATPSIARKMSRGVEPASRVFPPRPRPVRSEGLGASQLPVSREELGNDFYPRDELASMDSDYESVMNYLFAGGAGGISENPFQEALDDRGQNPDESGSESDDSGVEPTGSDESSSDQGDEPPAVDDTSPTEPVTGPPFSFLVVGGGLDRGGARLSHRAYRNGFGSFVLENGLRFSLVSGIVGGYRDFLVAVQGQQVVTAFSEVTEGMVYLVSLRAPIGTGLELRSNLSLAGPPEASGFFLYRSIRSFAPFDLNSDGRQEIVVSFFGDTNLVVYQPQDGELNYVKELFLPFEPASLVGPTRPLIFTNDYLQVFDELLVRSLSFSDRHPGVYSLSQPPSFRRVENIIVEPPVQGGPGKQFRILVYDDRFALFEDLGTHYTLLGSFSTAVRVPTVLVGDYLENGTQQLVLVP